jgi:hypothetical protein
MAALQLLMRETYRKALAWQYAPEGKRHPADIGGNPRRSARADL